MRADAQITGVDLKAFPPDNNECEISQSFFNQDKQDWDDALYMSRAMISLELNWITVALDNPSYYDKYQRRANEYVDKLRHLNLTCLRATYPDPSNKSIGLKIRDVLEAFARVKYANYIGTQKNQELTSDEAKIENLEQAKDAVVSAEQLLEQLPPDEPAQPFFRPLATNSLTQSKADLKSLRLSIQNTLSELSR